MVFVHMYMCVGAILGPKRDIVKRQTTGTTRYPNGREPFNCSLGQ